MPQFSKKATLEPGELTPLEREVVDTFNGLTDGSDPLMLHFRDRYAGVIQKLAYTLFTGLPESRWPSEIKTPRYPDIRDLFMTGVAVGYALRAREKTRK